MLEIVLDHDPGNATRAAKSSYKNAVNVGAGSYSVLDVERFAVDHGRIAEVEVVGHVEKGLGGQTGWPR